MFHILNTIFNENSITRVFLHMQCNIETDLTIISQNYTQTIHFLEVHIMFYSTPKDILFIPIRTHYMHMIS